MLWTRKPAPPSADAPSVTQYGSLTVDPSASRCVLDGVPYRCKIGAWTLFIPKTGLKLLHARDGRVECRHASRPPDEDLHEGRYFSERYSADDWLKALGMPMTRRVAEVFVASRRLAEAGLGPWPRGLAWVDTVSFDGAPQGGAAGLVLDNVDRLPRKRDANEADVLAAGVSIDRLRSCVRQQRRGYVIDLCSVVGCVPIDAESEVAAIERLLVEARG